MSEFKEHQWKAIAALLTVIGSVVAVYQQYLGVAKADLELKKTMRDSGGATQTNPVSPINPEPNTIPIKVGSPIAVSENAGSGIRSDPLPESTSTINTNSGNNDPSGVAAEAASILATSEDIQNLVRQTGMKLELTFDEDVSRRSATEKKILGSWTVTISGKAFCQYSAPRQWYGLGGITDFESAKKDAAEAGADLMAKYAREKLQSSYSGCSSKPK